jgi:carboxylesterase type B
VAGLRSVSSEPLLATQQAVGGASSGPMGGGFGPVLDGFTWAAGPMRSGHGYELPFVFDNVHEPVLHPSESRQQLADRMSGAWVAFARHGDPNHDGMAEWPPYDLDARPTMIFDRGTCRVEDDPWADERLAWRRPR